MKKHPEERTSSMTEDTVSEFENVSRKRPRRPHRKSPPPPLLVPDETFKSSERLPEVKPYVHRKPTVNPLRKLYMDKEKQKLQKLYKIESPDEEEDILEEDLFVKRQLNRDRKKIRRKDSGNEGDIIVGRRKSDLVVPVSDLPISRFVHSDIRRSNNVMQKRILETEKRRTINDYDDGGKEPIDQKAVESEFERISKPKTKNDDIEETPVNQNNSDVASSFDQMSFWRERFESERIKSFLSTKKKMSKEEEDLEKPEEDNDKDVNMYNMRRGGSARDTVSEINYVTNTPSMRTRGPQSQASSEEDSAKKYSPRVMRPLLKVPKTQKKAIKDTSKRPIKPHKRHSSKIEALPFMSKEEKENEEIQVVS